jgi:hypothetical protein
MKIFFIGGIADRSPGSEAALTAFCEKAGTLLGDSPHQVVLCSCQPGSADRAVLEGIARATSGKQRGRIIVHRPDHAVVRQQWRNVQDRLALTPQFHDHHGPELYLRNDSKKPSKEGLRLAYLLCQLKAMEESDVVVALGGKSDGASALLLAIARDRTSAILPYRFLGGVAEHTYRRLEKYLNDRLGQEGIEKLSEPAAGAGSILELIKSLQGPPMNASPRVFLSYAWARPEYADMVEVILRRHPNVTVFRDERNIEQADRIDDRIEREIRQECNIFIVLWGREYVESPNCFDELALWTKHHGYQNLFLLRFDQTRPVWPTLRNSAGDRGTFRANWPVVSVDRRSLRQLVSEIIDNFTNQRSAGGSS